LWQHYKGGVYRIVAANARMEISGEPCVVYATVDRPDDVWVRLRIAFLNEAAFGVPRFRQLDPKTKRGRKAYRAAARQSRLPHFFK
jgi:hypothetical protein